MFGFAIGPKIAAALASQVAGLCWMLVNPNDNIFGAAVSKPSSPEQPGC
jgi:hypothetical protein